MSSAFGVIVTPDDVARAAIATLRAWMPYYVAEVERQRGHVSGDPWPPAPLSYTAIAAGSITTWPEDKQPAVVAICPGLARQPELDGSGLYRATWRLGVGVMVSARDMDSTDRMAGLYGAAARAVIVQHPSLGGFAARSRWMDESLDDVPVDATRTLRAAVEEFEVDVDGVVSAADGPSEIPDPAPDPHDEWPEWPIADPVIVTTEPEPLT